MEIRQRAWSVDVGNSGISRNSILENNTTVCDSEACSGNPAERVKSVRDLPRDPLYTSHVLTKDVIVHCCLEYTPVLKISRRISRVRMVTPKHL